MLSKLNCAQVRYIGSHVIARCGRCQTVVPKRGGDIRPGTLRSIVRDLEPCLGEGWLS
jgi:predicted RNA binding protein YcfA (HicA-like mRNA interferase family)